MYVLYFKYHFSSNLDYKWALSLFVKATQSITNVITDSI